MNTTYDQIVSYSVTRNITRGNSIWRILRGSLNTLGVVLAVWLVCVITGAFLFRAIEHSTTGVSWTDSFYWAIQVASTTGPGDVTPKTDMGKYLFMGYNLIVSVLLLLILGANIIVRAIENADVLTHREQEWSFFVQQETYAVAAWNTQLLCTIAQRLDIPLPPLLEGQDPLTFAIRPCPPQPGDTND